MENKEQEVYCRKCSAKFSGDKCPNCNCYVNSQDLSMPAVCPKCHEQMKESICRNCGYDIIKDPENLRKTQKSRIKDTISSFIQTAKSHPKASCAAILAIVFIIGFAVGKIGTVSSSKYNKIFEMNRETRENYDDVKANYDTLMSTYSKYKEKMQPYEEQQAADAEAAEKVQKEAEEKANAEAAEKAQKEAEEQAAADSDTPAEKEIEIYEYLDSLFDEGVDEEEADALAMEKYDLTSDELNAIWLKVTMQKYADAEAKTGDYTLKYGELVDVNVNAEDDIIVIKAKISPSYNNEATINQNYYNIEDLVKNQGISAFSELQYWAVADMTDGSESKVISFTVSSDTMKRLKNNEIVANKLGSYVDDLWILQSLLKDN